MAGALNPSDLVLLFLGCGAVIARCSVGFLIVATASVFCLGSIAGFETCFFSWLFWVAGVVDLLFCFTGWVAPGVVVAAVTLGTGTGVSGRDWEASNLALADFRRDGFNLVFFLTTSLPDTTAVGVDSAALVAILSPTTGSVSSSERFKSLNRRIAPNSYHNSRKMVCIGYECVSTRQYSRFCV
jgi:hypothetical protein